MYCSRSEEMIMILTLLFVGVCACAALTPPPPPPYLQIQRDIAEVGSILKEHITSMEGSIPGLQDHRRHYAQIFHVVYYEADSQAGCFIPPYDLEYQKNINKAAPKGLSDPETVINETQKLIDNVKNRTNVIEQIINKECLYRIQNCDDKVAHTLHTLYGPGQAQIPIYIAAGKAADAIIKKHAEFLAASQAHGGLQYVVGGMDKLQEVVHQLAGLLRELYKPVYMC